MNLLLVGSNDSTLSDLSGILAKYDDVSVYRAESGEKALETVACQEIDLAIAAEEFEDATGLEFAKELVVVNPMIHCVLVSSMSAADFHEASEGLGILMQLSKRTNEKQVKELLQQLRQIQGISGGKGGEGQ